MRIGMIYDKLPVTIHSVTVSDRHLLKPIMVMLMVGDNEAEKIINKLNDGKSKAYLSFEEDKEQ